MKVYSWEKQLSWILQQAMFEYRRVLIKIVLYPMILVLNHFGVDGWHLEDQPPFAFFENHPPMVHQISRI